jgi:large subunit ribosomal protein L6
MSRIGKLPITLPKGVTLAVDDNLVSIKGPLGELNRQITPEVHVDIKEDQVFVLVNDDSKRTRALHGLTRTLLNNMVLGVHKKFEIDLELKGVGYRCQAAKDKVTLSLGFSHPIILPLPKDVEVTVEANTNIKVAGINKEEVGFIASKIRSFRPPEPYNGKGVLYKGEQVLRKAGKTGKKIIFGSFVIDFYGSGKKYKS